MGHPQGTPGPAVPMGQSPPTRSGDVPKHHHRGGDPSSARCPRSPFPEFCGVSTALGRGTFIPTLDCGKRSSGAKSQQNALLSTAALGGTAPSCSLTNIPALPAARPDKSSTRVCCAHIYIYIYIYAFFSQEYRITSHPARVLSAKQKCKRCSEGVRGVGTGTWKRCECVVCI